MKKSSTKPSSGARHGRRAAAGATLSEMVASIAILGALAGFAVPEFAAWAASSDLESRSTVFLSGIQLARSEAIKRNAKVVLCKSADGEACSLAGGWEAGVLVFEDANNDAQRGSEEHVISRQPPISGSFLLRGNGAVQDYLSYGPTGQATMVSGAFQAGTLTLCRQSTKRGEARQIVINAGGRPKSQRVRVASCE